MKKSQYAYCLSLVLIISTMILAAPVTSAYSLEFIGDIDGDFEVGAADATLAQRYSTRVTGLSKKQLYIGDVDNNGEVDIVDATRIQRHATKLNGGFYTYYVSTSPAIENFASDFDSGMAMPGIPVTFYGEGSGYGPLSYEFSVDGTVIQERSEADTFVYSFPDTGVYNVTLTLYNDFDEITSYTLPYQVTEPYETVVPVITSAHFNHLYNRYSSHTVTTFALGGTTPYQYCYTISGKSDEIEYIESRLGDFHPDDSAREGEFKLTTGYIDENKINIPVDGIDKIIPEGGLSGASRDYAVLTLTVTVKDVNDTESMPYQITFKIEDIPQ